ncbi:hypothetical protein [Cohnella yongneupensis]|uniref:Uncharacterized protein n=1 Tax=Cohnella yongneupensis TaxID=425006 RepID=A0ABW0R6V1_9BACL
MTLIMKMTQGFIAVMLVGLVAGTRYEALYLSAVYFYCVLAYFLFLFVVLPVDLILNAKLGGTKPSVKLVVQFVTLLALCEAIAAALIVTRTDFYVGADLYAFAAEHAAIYMMLELVRSLFVRGDLKLSDVRHELPGGLGQRHVAQSHETDLRGRDFDV